MHAIGIKMRFRSCLEIFAMGTFMNTFVPGGTGGDLLRAFYVAQALQQDRTGGVLSVVLDRGMGLLGLLTVAVLLGLIAPDHEIASSLVRSLALLAAAVLGAISFQRLPALSCSRRCGRRE